MILVRSSLLEGAGFRHGFSLRQGGVSVGPFESLNLGRTLGDEPAHVAENVRRFAEAVGVAPAQLMEVSQVHGRTVAEANRETTQDALRLMEADALVTDVPEHAVAVRTADCVPLLIADPSRGAVAAVHAGWRGVVARVLHASLSRMRHRYGSQPETLLVAIGPHIRRYEVSEEVAARLEEAGLGADVVDRSAPRPHVRLAETLRAQLRAFGIRPGQIDDVGGCTLDEPSRFFSHRRDRGQTGRHLSAIVARRP